MPEPWNISKVLFDENVSQVDLPFVTRRLNPLYKVAEPKLTAEEVLDVVERMTQPQRDRLARALGVQVGSSFISLPIRPRLYDFAVADMVAAAEGIPPGFVVMRSPTQEVWIDLRPAQDPAPGQ